MQDFTPFASLAGGVLIGLSASAMLVLLGRIAGVSGIVGGLLEGDTSAWRMAFVAGLVAGGCVALAVEPQAFAPALDRSPAALALAGLFVGYGSRLGSGCTSGHGVCGIARASKRSIAATLTFMASGALTVFVVARLFGGRI